MEIKISLLEMECKGKKLFIYYQIKKSKLPLKYN